jgi:hypothetical protein
MPAYINFVCENSKVCHTVQNVGFESPDETWGDLLSAIRKIGWRIEGVLNTNKIKTYCPNCK